MTESPWYWNDAECDHDAVGLVACAEETGLTHYALPGKRETACGHTSEGLRLAGGPVVVTCHACCKVAREDRDLIDQRYVKSVILGASRMNFISRERARRGE